MDVLKKLLLVGLALMLAGCATTNRVPTDYAGADAGQVVLGMGAANGTSYSSYSLMFRKRGAAAAGEAPSTGRFTYFQSNIFYKQAPDYQAATEQGVVLVNSLPAGDYEIYNFDVFFNGGTVQKNFGSRADFSVPFTVKPGQVTYLGNYQANGLRGENFLGMALPAGAVFAVSSRMAAEMALAQAKSKAPLGEATDATPQPSRVGNPFIVSPR